MNGQTLNVLSQHGVTEQSELKLDLHSSHKCKKLISFTFLAKMVTGLSKLNLFLGLRFNFSVISEI